MSKELKFASTKQAFQHLADITGKRIKIAAQDSSKEEQEDVVSDGSIQDIQNMLKTEKIYDINRLLGSAIWNNRPIKIIETILAAGAKFDEDHLDYAIQNKRSDLVKQIMKSGIKPSKYDFENAVKNGNEEGLNILIQTNPDKETTAFDALMLAAKNGKTSMVKKLGAYIWTN